MDLLLALVTGGTLIGYRATSPLWRQIARAESQSRLGMMDVQCVLLRSFRLAWLGLAMVSAILLLSSTLHPVDLCNGTLSVSWLATVSVASCSPSPPAVSTVRRDPPCLAGAG